MGTILMNNDFEKAEEIALKLLKTRHTKRRLAEKLMRRDFSRETIAEVCEKMERLGYINDSDYAEAFVHDCVMLHRYGPRKIRQALFTRGINGELSSRALQGIDEEMHLENLRFLLAKATLGEDFLSEYEAGRFYRKMESRGFLRSQIETVLSEIDILEENSYEV